MRYLKEYFPIPLILFGGIMADVSRHAFEDIMTSSGLVISKSPFDEEDEIFFYIFDISNGTLFWNNETAFLFLLYIVPDCFDQPLVRSTTLGEPLPKNRTTFHLCQARQKTPAPFVQTPLF